MPQLNDTQSVLLATAAQRESGSLYPLPETIAAGPRIAAAMAKLLGAALIEERTATTAAEEHRSDGDDRFGLYVTPAGLAVIGIEPAEEDDLPARSPAVEATPTSTRASKASQVVALLSRKSGATLSELIAATNWLPHTTRAALTGLRKKGHVIERRKRGDVTCYHVLAVGAA